MLTSRRLLLRRRGLGSTDAGGPSGLRRFARRVRETRPDATPEAAVAAAANAAVNGLIAAADIATESGVHRSGEEVLGEEGCLCGCATGLRLRRSLFMPQTPRGAQGIARRTYSPRGQWQSAPWHCGRDAACRLDGLGRWPHYGRPMPAPEGPRRGWTSGRMAEGGSAGVCTSVNDAKGAINAR